MLWSVVVIAKNENATLPRLVHSLKEFQVRGGAIIVLDTGSTDSTPEVARSLGCEVHCVGDQFVTTISEEMAKEINERFNAEIVQPNEKLFRYDEARNYAASLSKTDMVSMPDCDEVFTTYDLDAITKSIEEGVEQLEYPFVFNHDQFGKPLIQFYHCKFYNRTKLQWTGIVHEVLSGEAKRVTLPETIIKLEHFQNQQTNRKGYLTGLAYDCYLNPDKDRQSHYFARELMYRGFYKAALREFKRHIAMDKWLQEKGQSYIHIGDCYSYLGKEDKAVEYWQKAFTIDSSRRETLMKLAEHYFKKNDHQKIAAYSEAALTVKNNGFYANNQEHYESKPHEYLYFAYWYLGEFKKSADHFFQALEKQPLSSKYLHDLRFYKTLPTVTILIPTLGREEGLKRCKASIAALNYPSELIQVLVYDGEGTVPEKVKRGVEESTGEYIVYAANDMEFTPDSLIQAVIYSANEKKALVSFNTGPLLSDNGNINEHFIIKREFISELRNGEIFDTRYFHVGVDNWLHAQAEKLNQFGRCESAQINHYHFSTGKSEMDDVYKKGWNQEKVDHDRILLQQDLATL